MSEALGKLSAAAAKRLGIPPEVSFYSPFPFAGMNQTDSRTALDDTEWFWIENYILTGRASLRTLWDHGPALYTAPPGKTIVWFSWYNIGPTFYAAIFLNDGTAYQVRQSDGAVTTISATPNTFYRGGQLPFAVQSAAQYLLISNNNTPNDYWIWDGTVLYSAGSIAPIQPSAIIDGGTGYTSIPSYTVYGGSGSGVVLTPVVAEGSVVRLIVVNPGSGYLPGEIVQVAFSGGGSDTTPVLVAVLANRPVASVTLLAGGNGYTNGLNFALGFTGGGGGSGAAGLFDVVAGVVTNVRLMAGGTNYSATPAVNFLASAGGTGAVAAAILDQDSVASVTIVNGGTGLTGTPLITFVGGGGSGAVATASLTGGVITGVDVSNGGAGYSTAPAVEVSAGLNNAAAAILELMPFGVSGTSIETFLSRIWLSSPASLSNPLSATTLLVSAPGSLTDFATSDGGLLFSNNSRFQRATYVALRQSNGFLYPISDSSVDVISNVQTAGSPATTNFNYLNSSAQIGAAWRDSCQDFGQSVLFGNENGIHGLYGGSVRRVSGKINDAFVTAFPLDPISGAPMPLPGALLPSSAMANIYTIPCYVFLMTSIDPLTQQKRNILYLWEEKNWTAASQTTSLTYIGTQEQNSRMSAWGTDGNTFFQLFAEPSATLPKVLATKLYGGEREMILKETLNAFYRATDKSSGQAGVALTAVMEGTGVQTQIGAYPPQPASRSAPNPVQPNFLAPTGSMPSWAGASSNVPGTAVGATITSTSPDFVLSGLSVAYRELEVLFG